jgi:tetratricopeptide (TPR) repeat protein
LHHFIVFIVSLSKEWRKAIAICDQILLLRPKCIKALMRSGIAYSRIGDLDEAEGRLSTALSLCAKGEVNSTGESGEEDPDIDRSLVLKIEALLSDLRRRRIAAEASLKKQHAAMSRVFGGNTTSTATVTSQQRSDSENMKKQVRITLLAAVIVVFVAIYFSMQLRY